MLYVTKHEFKIRNLVQRMFMLNIQEYSACPIQPIDIFKLIYIYLCILYGEVSFNPKKARYVNLTHPLWFFGKCIF